MNTIKKLIFTKNSPVLRAKDNKEMMLSVYFLASIIAIVLTSSILGL